MISEILSFADGARQLVFFERNGEKRHEYSLKTTDEEKLVGLSWDVSGTILMMHYIGKLVDRRKFPTCFR